MIAGAMEDDNGPPEVFCPPAVQPGSRKFSGALEAVQRTPASPENFHDEAAEVPRTPAPPENFHDEAAEVPRTPAPPENFHDEAAEDASTRSSFWYGCQSALGIGIACAIVGIAMAFMPPVLDLSFGSFSEADVPSSVEWGSFSAAKSQMNTVSGDGRRLGRILKPFFFTLIYDSGSRPIATVENLKAIAEFELALRAMPPIQSHCTKDIVLDSHVSLCNPGHSLVNFVFPARNTSSTGQKIVPETLHWDGSGKDPLPMSVTLSVVNSRGWTSEYFPRSATPTSATNLRSTYFFIFEYDDAPEKAPTWKSRIKANWGAMLQHDVFPAIRKSNLHSSMTEAGIKVYLIGSGVDTLRILATVRDDLLLAIGSLVFVVLYMSFHMKSIMLSIVGLFIVFLSLPLAYAAFAVISGTNVINISFFVSVFLMCGIGTDTVFVYNDCWLQSRMHRDKESDRLRWTYQTGGKASLVTSVATSVSFFANLASVIKPLREFGLFMGLCVVWTFLLMPVIFAPLCLLSERYWNKRKPNGHTTVSDDASNLRDIAQVPEPSRCARLRSNIIDRFCDHLQRWRWFFSVIPVVVLIAFTIVAARRLKLRTSNQELYASDHDESRKVVLQERFSGRGIGTLGPPTVTSKVCDADAFQHSADCQVLWCEGERARSESSCNIPRTQRGAHNLSSQKAMKQAGWIFGWKDNSFRPGPNLSCGFEGYSSESSYWGYCTGDVHGVLTLAFEGGPGIFDLTFSNLASMGTVEAFLSGDSVAVASPMDRQITVSMVFPPGANLTIREVSGVIGIHSFSISCIQHNNTCQCQRREAEFCPPERGNATVRRVVGLHSSTNAYAVKPIIIERWFDGVVVSMPVQDVLLTEFRATDPPCGWDEICFCNTDGLVCLLSDGWGKKTLIPIMAVVDSLEERRLDDLQPPRGTSLFLPRDRGALDLVGIEGFRERCSHSHRRLEWKPFGPEKVSKLKQGEISVVFGITSRSVARFLGTSDPTKMWAFNDVVFDSPWTQRLMRSFCTDFPESLRVVKQICWIHNFQSFVEDGGRLFPLRPTSFTTSLLSWASFGRIRDLKKGFVHDATHFLWFREGILKASHMSFLVDFAADGSSDSVDAYKEQWNAYLRVINGPRMFGKAPMAFHTSSMWVQADVAGAVVASTGITLLIAVVTAFLCMVLFTRSLVLSFYVAIETILVICGLFFFVVVVAGRAIGPVEVIGFILFIGYSVTYSLHVAHHYMSADSTGEGLPEGLLNDHAPRRLQRARLAVKSIGSAVLGSAVTTVGSSFFMLLCTLQIFSIFGTLSIVVSILSVFAAFVNLLALIFACGPTEPGCLRGKSLLVATPVPVIPDGNELPQPLPRGTLRERTTPTCGVSFKFRL
eukprot:TRINITY_DN12886_c0_g2_i3.p1 TRINITY_DN12886_c0_g2~~TRINITY_DN12886_c0_g2_i3.p1  ORF type:complete len:1371 (-),score=151.51 TRINITY_DN12886_c0_g2_i3:56-4168(-)